MCGEGAEGGVGIGLPTAEGGAVGAVGGEAVEERETLGEAVVGMGEERLGVVVAPIEATLQLLAGTLNEVELLLVVAQAGGVAAAGEHPRGIALHGAPGLEARKNDVVDGIVNLAEAEGEVGEAAVGFAGRTASEVVVAQGPLAPEARAGDMTLRQHRGY